MDLSLVPDEILHMIIEPVIRTYHKPRQDDIIDVTVRWINKNPYGGGIQDSDKYYEKYTWYVKKQGLVPLSYRKFGLYMLQWA